MGNVTKVIENSNSVEEWKEAIPYAQNCIALSKEIQNLKATDELILKIGIVELVGQFKFTVERANKYFIERLETQNKGQLQNWVEKEEPKMLIYLHEIDIYVQDGKRTQAQLREELSELLNEEIEFAIVSGTDDVMFILQVSEENKVLVKAKISIILIMLFVVCDKAFSTGDNSEQEIDFNIIGSSDIINIVDEYNIVSSGGAILYEK